jgi:acylphosphatase
VLARRQPAVGAWRRISLISRLDMKTLRLIIHGRVQGVFYRESMRREAERLSVSGWVRNRDDGTVEAIAHGTIAAVDALVHWAHRGPEHARVERVDVSTAQGSHAGFVILR